MSHTHGSSHTYLKNAEEREESGTPDVLGSLRAGLAIEVRNRVGAELISRAEEAVISRVMNGLQVCGCGWVYGGVCECVWVYVVYVREEEWVGLLVGLCV